MPADQAFPRTSVPVVAEADLRERVRRVVDETPVLDVHAHIYPPRFGPLLLWGIDELLTYHYLIAEVFRVAPIEYDRFFSMSKPQQADYVWRHLFVDRSPLSEACRGVLTVLQSLGLDVVRRDLGGIRRWFSSQEVEAHVERVFELARVRRVIMTNDPFDPHERAVWMNGWERDERFQAALRIDPLLNDWHEAAGQLRELGYPATGDLGRSDRAAARRFLEDWVARIRPRYMAASLPPDFAYPQSGPRTAILEECVLPVAREARLPFAMMIGVRRGLNPALRLAGDGAGRADVSAIDRLCQAFPENRFLVTMLSRENQHELCVSARKHPNLHVFGCWWFLNVPSVIDEMTRERIELLGLSFTPQHSDARVLEQLIYKWSHTREAIGAVLGDKYAGLARTGWPVTEGDIRRDVEELFGGAFDRFCAGG